MGSIRCEIRNNQVIEIHKIVVHRFNLSYVEDPDIYAAEPIWKWQNSEQGEFVMKHSISAPVFHKSINHNTMGYEYAIVAELEKKKLSEFYLKFDKTAF